MTYALIVRAPDGQFLVARGIRLVDWTQAHRAMRYPHPSTALRARAAVQRKYAVTAAHIVPTPQLLAILAGRLPLP